MNIIYNMGRLERETSGVWIQAQAQAQLGCISVSTPVLTQPHLSASLYDICPTFKISTRASNCTPSSTGLKTPRGPSCTRPRRLSPSPPAITRLSSRKQPSWVGRGGAQETKPAEQRKRELGAFNLYYHHF